MNIRALVIVTIAALVLLQPAPGSAQDALTQAKALYASADYDQALKLLEGARGDRDSYYYRALCLIALGRNDAAQTQIESLVTVDPLFVPPAGENSPRVTATFTDTRRRLLPQLARKTFNEARQLFQSGDRTRAREQFKLTMQMLDDSLIDEGADLADLRLVASGFLDLVETEKPEAAAAAAAAASPAAATPIAPPPAIAGGSAAVPRAVAGTATLPLTIEQTLPPWRPDGIAARRSYVGSVQVSIDAEGRVTSARMARPVHASYDPLVLAAARKWLYKPATLNGVPVASEKTVEIELRPDR